MPSAPPDAITPPAVARGGRIGVFAPSSRLAWAYPDRFQKGVRALGSVLGVSVVVADQAADVTDYRAGSAEARAAAFMDLVLDPDVSAVMAASGGYNSADLLPFLDAAAMRANPKVLVGYSDVTSLLLGVQALAGWHTFHGPTVMTDLGEAPAPHPFTVEHLRAAICEDAGGHAGQKLPDPPEWTAELVDWGTPDWLRGRAHTSPATRQVWREGCGRGRLFGGNVATLNHLVGTPYYAPPSEVVLMLEATGQEASLPVFQRALTHLRQTGLFGRVRALLVGRCPDAFAVGGRTLRDVVLEATAGHDFPVVADLPFGHTSPIWTLPLGVEATVEAAEDGASIRLAGRGVA